MIVNLIEDLSVLTTIPDTSLSKLADKSQLVICHAIEEAKLNEEEYVEIDLALGTLVIKISSDEIKYKFIPSTKFEANVAETVISGKNPLIDSVEESLRNRVMKVYKELF